MLCILIVCRCSSISSSDPPVTAPTTVAKLDGRRSSVKAKMATASAGISTGRPLDQFETDVKQPSSKVIVILGHFSNSIQY